MTAIIFTKISSYLKENIGNFVHFGGFYYPLLATSRFQ